jgi:hypothetical protein
LEPSTGAKVALLDKAKIIRNNLLEVWVHFRMVSIASIVDLLSNDVVHALATQVESNDSTVFRSAMSAS